MQIKHVLILEDHKLASQILSEVVLGVFPDAILKTASNIEYALLILEQQSFDLALIDLGLPDGSGMEVIKNINQNQTHTKIVVTTIFSDEKNLFNALKLGAYGYLLKGHSKDELTNYLIKMLNGHPPLSPQIAQNLLNYFHEPNKQKQPLISQKEQEILKLITQGLIVKQIAYRLKIAESTVSTHIKHIYKKLGVHNRSQVIAKAIDMRLDC